MTSTIEQRCSNIGRSVSATLCVQLVVCLSGCDSGPRTHPVSGTVHYSDGTVVRTGYVEFVPLAGGPSGRGKIELSGKFKVGTYEAADGVAAGDYVVLVTQHTPPLSPEAARQLGPEHAQHAGSNQVVSLRYADRRDSDLACTVSDSRANSFDFVVEPHEPLSE